MKLKICGVQNTNEASLLLERGVDFVGLNFVPTSKRRIDEGVAKDIVACIDGTDTKSVALFQNAPIESVLATLDALGVSYVQLHGGESTDYINELSKAGYKTIKSVPVNRESAMEQVETYIDNHLADVYLLDRAQQGSGEAVNPELAARLSQKHKIMLAGGINTENLNTILNNLGDASIYGIDIAAGVRDDLTLNLNKLDKVIDLVRAKQ